MNEQQETWAGEFGNEYVERNLEFHDVQYTGPNTGYNRLTITKSFFEDMPRDASILELGCNVGSIIWILNDMGFTDVTGIDINKKAIKMVNDRYPHYRFFHSSIEDFPISKKYDMVFTSGVLIHINPTNIMPVIEKIKSLSSKWIFGFEYYSEEFEDISYYRKVSKGNLNWTGNYAKLFNMKPERLELYEVRKAVRAKIHCYYLINSLYS